MCIRDRYNTIYSKGILKEGIEEVKLSMEITPEIQYIINFIENAQRGIIR